MWQTALSPGAQLSIDGGTPGGGNGQFKRSPGPDDPDTADRTNRNGSDSRMTVQPEGDTDHWVAAHLRRAYAEVAEEPLPETFRALLARLKRGNGQGPE